VARAAIGICYEGGAAMNPTSVAAFTKWITAKDALARGEDVCLGIRVNARGADEFIGDPEELLGLYVCRQCGFESTVVCEVADHVKHSHGGKDIPSAKWRDRYALISSLIDPDPTSEIYPEDPVALDEEIRLASDPLWKKMEDEHIRTMKQNEEPGPWVKHGETESAYYSRRGKEFQSFITLLKVESGAISVDELRALPSADNAVVSSSVDDEPQEPEEEGEWTQYGLTRAEYFAEQRKPYPVFNYAVQQPGPSWSDDILYGIAGKITRKISASCETHPAALYLDFLVAIGNMLGRRAYFTINTTKHFTNEFVALVGPTSKARKGTGQDAVMDLLSKVDSNWSRRRVSSGFGSGQAFINEIRDDVVQMVRDKKTNTFHQIIVPGEKDKRLFVHEGELAAIFNLANMRDSQVDVILRDGWDGRRLNNKVKGKTQDGVSQSVCCENPQFSISAGTTIPELRSKMPKNADENGFANRFIYCYLTQTKLCPNGGPPLDWTEEIKELNEIISFAEGIEHVPMSDAAHLMMTRIYLKLANRPDAPINVWIARGPAHIRRLAMIFTLLDKCSKVESHHLQAARAIWEYSEDSARYIVVGCSKDQQRIIKWVVDHKSVTLTQIREQLFQRNKTMAWVKVQVDDLIHSGFLVAKGDQIQRGGR
jgi:hypothetical protein